MFSVAEPGPPVRRSRQVHHRIRPRLPARNRLFLGDRDDASIGGMLGKPAATAQPPHRALVPDRQMSRSRQGQALLRRETP